MTRRVAYVTHYAEMLGANRSMLDLVLELKRRQAVDPLVILPREGPLSERLEAEGVRYKVLPFEPWMSERHYMGRPHHRFMQWRRYERAANERHAKNNALLPMVAGFLREQGIELVHLNSAAVGLAEGLKAATGLPLVWHIRELPERQYLLHIDRGRRAYGRALCTADRLIAISRAVQSDILTYTRRPVDTELIYNGVLHAERYLELRSRAAARWTSTTPYTFALVGLIHPSKGQEEAVRAIDIVRRSRPEVKLIIAGHGKDHQLRELIADLGVGGHVELTGYVDEPFGVFARAHTCLMCSRNEAMGRVTVEGMGSGLPMIGHASGGTVELVEEGVTGLLYPDPSDGVGDGADALARRMLRLVNDPALARALGDRAMDIAAERFSIERMTDQVLEVYGEVIPR